MQRELRRYSTFGNKAGILYLCSKVLTGKQEDVESVKFSCGVVKNIELNIKCGILVLEELKILKTDNKVFMSSGLVYETNCEDKFIRQLCIICIKYLLKEEHINWCNIKYDEDKNCFVIPSRSFSFYSAVFRNMLIELEALKKSELGLIVTSEYESLFKAVVSEKKRVSQKELLFQLELEKQMGAEGEIFVLSYEKERCPFSESQKNNIKQISDVDVSAGYDIVSYNSNTDLSRRYIEVKTFKGNVHFHWSENEIRSSKLRGDSYFLYLVEYDSMKKDGYEPLMIKNPYLNIYMNEEWEKKADSYSISQVSIKKEE